MPATTNKFEEELAALLAQPRNRIPSELFGDVSDDFWLWMHTGGRRSSAALRELLPGLPTEAAQRRFTFKTGDDTLAEGFGIYLLVRDLYERHVGSIRDADGILDFGCGYGRVIRFFLKDVDHHGLTGTDTDAALIDFCRQSNRWCTFVQNGTEPPLPFDDGQFQFAFVYSVFSHFSEEMHLRWLHELKRVLRPGGALAISVRRRNYLRALQEMRGTSTEDESRITLKMFLDTDRELARYDAGEFVFEPYPYESRVDTSWGEACIPRSYIEREWSRLFDVVEFVEGKPLDLEQLQRSPHPISEQNFVLLQA